MRLINATSDKNISSIVETCDGSIVTETIGVCKEGIESSVGSGPFVVLYQRGLRKNQRKVSRSHRNLLSPFKIKCIDIGTANVPWVNFSWISKNKTHAYVDKVQCTSCGIDEWCSTWSTCSSCFSNVKVENIKVVWMHDTGGKHNFQWYVAFSCDDDVLTRVPDSVVASILKCVAKRTPEGHCTCGRCTHAVVNMTPCTSRTWAAYGFCFRAVKLFASYRGGVYRRVRGEEKLLSSMREDDTSCISNPQEIAEDGTCAVCLEETVVSNSSCIQKKCSLKVCSECYKKTMGLCPLCDRLKLSPSASFQCNTCKDSVSLKDYGFECVTCDKPELCNQCYKSFSMCLSCELNITDSSKQSKKRNREEDTTTTTCAC
tara:strand:- start:8089 stop:9207 length:1119 start_codon:yes stop_codon:yes gene_type:complete